MDLKNVSYRGPAIDDVEVFERLPPVLANGLRSINGWVQFHGGLHVRGACLAPAWHSLRTVWFGQDPFWELYDSVEPDWVPFAEDCLGDQFFLTPERVVRLDAETGEIEDEAASLAGFLAAVNRAPTATLALEPLITYLKRGGRLEPGQLLRADPPFCTPESAGGVTLHPVEAAQLYLLHADLYDARAAGDHPR